MKREFWVSYPTIGSIYKNKGSALVSKYKNHMNLHKEPLYHGKDIWSFINIKIIGKDYNIFSLDFQDDSDAQDVFDSVLKLTVLGSVSQLYAYIYTSNKAESSLNSWNLYNPLNEFQRQGLDLGNPNSQCLWRISEINKDYQFCSSYPNLLVVPHTVSDTLLSHSVKYRSQNRSPVLTYYYKKTGSSVTRCAQPLPGITQQRSIQDEKLIYEIFKCSSSSTSKNIIVDARPATNAMAQTALGGGTENMDNYHFNNTCSRMFLGIDNIHVMRDTLNFMVDNFLFDNDLDLEINKENLSSGKSSQWLKYIRMLLSSADVLAKSIIFNKSNLLIHCSDGWDRTAQICSLVQIFLDPYFRTSEGFMVLVEKDWLSFGHRFCERSGHLSSESIFHNNSTRVGISGTTNFPESGNLYNDKKENDLYDLTSSVDLVSKVSNRFKKRAHLKYTSPIFQQFLDCVYQLLIQNPENFEFNERFLRRLVYHLYSCQYGTFLFDNEYERIASGAHMKTQSVWDYFLSRKSEFTNVGYKPQNCHNEDWLSPDLTKIQWWWQLFGRRAEELNNLAEETTNNIQHLGENSTNSMGTKFRTFSFDIFSKK